jgi:4-oxalocrotonate tautomerase family enzyme
MNDYAARLQKAVADRTAIGPLDVPDLATGYAVQRELRTAAGPLVGWKLGVTSRAKQAQVGVDSPIYGFLEGANALDLGAPLDTSALIQPRCEPEIVFVLGRDLAGPHVTAADVVSASSGVAVGIEVLDSRYRDYKFTMPDVVADNTSAGRFVVGTPVPPAGIDLRLVGVVLEKNGELVATASGAASLGHPAAAVAWMVRAMAADGEGLRAGDVVLSGGLTGGHPGDGGRRRRRVDRSARHPGAGRPLGDPMPLVQITLARGRTEEQLQALGEAVTTAVHEAVGAPRENVRVVITECEPEHWFVGGESLAELQSLRQALMLGAARRARRRGARRHRPTTGAASPSSPSPTASA